MGKIESFFQKQITRAISKEHQIETSKHPHLVIFSDCHRGIGNWSDSFLGNKTIYEAALDYYYKRGYTYVELGDGDELWENRNFFDIKEVHGDIFQSLTKFHLENKLFMVIGNHDKEKAYRNMTPFPVYYESLCLADGTGQRKVHMLHGHQADLINNQLWRISRWLVRYIWNPLELSGIKDPTSAAKNYNKRRTIEARLAEWARNNGTYLIAGHTHRPAIPGSDEEWGYFNSGSCVHPNTITCLEVNYGQITLVKWVTCSDDSLQVKVCRNILGGPRKVF